MIDKTISCNNVQLFVTKKDAILRDPSSINKILFVSLESRFASFSSVHRNSRNVIKRFCCVRWERCSHAKVRNVARVVPNDWCAWYIIMHYAMLEIHFIKCFRIFSVKVFAKIYPFFLGFMSLTVQGSQRGQRWTLELCDVNSQEQREHS